MESIKDLIYFDFEKARSLSSQLKGGVINGISRAIETEGELDSSVGFDVHFFKGGLGGRDKEKNVRIEKIELYHELLNQLENELKEKSLLTDLNNFLHSSFKGSFNQITEKIPSFSFIKATGWSQFEDFERFKNIFTNFNEIQRLIYSSVLQENPDFKKLQEDLRNARKIANTIPDRNKKTKELDKVKAFEKKLDAILNDETGIYIMDEEFIDRLKTFLDTFSPNRLNFRLLPFDEFNDFQILANLKEKNLLGNTFENIIYTYGSRPNIKLTVFGIITSCPRESDSRVDLSDEYLAYDDSELKDDKGFDKAFRSVFKSFEEFEKYFFVPTYPKIAISPIAIYQEVLMNKGSKTKT